jgi:hypothetical protein
MSWQHIKQVRKSVASDENKNASRLSEQHLTVCISTCSFKIKQFFMFDRVFLFQAFFNVRCTEQINKGYVNSISTRKVFLNEERAKEKEKKNVASLFLNTSQTI